jgi:hypothetical protein
LKLGAKIFGILGGVLCLYLVVGLLLPGTWEARVEVDLPYLPEQVFPFLNGIDQWQRWMPMPESGAEPFGPREGVGAGLLWDDPRYGRGKIEIAESVPGSRVSYVVEVEEGALLIHGVLELAGNGGRSLLRWEEKGDFGWNPLMGYAARGMGSSQEEAMRSSLEELRRLLAGR